MPRPGDNQLPGLDKACQALADGAAVIVPNPSPMTYGIVGLGATAVNDLKQRTSEQNVAISLHDSEWPSISSALDVPSDTLPRIATMLRGRLSLLVPLRERAWYPDWIEPAVKHGHLAMFRGWWEPTAQLWDRFPRLFGSSANRTGAPPAASAAEAFEIFGTDAPIVDGDALRDLDAPHTASSMVRVAPDGELSLHRTGAQDAATGLDPDAYIRWLDTALNTAAGLAPQPSSDSKAGR